MTFVETVPAESATGELAAIYDEERARLGYLPNFVQAFSSRPEVYRAWQQLNGAIKASMDLRRYELATLAAARKRRSSYCSLAHGTLLARDFYDAETVAGLPGGLDEADAAIMAFAEQVADDPGAVTESDVARLRELGLSDDEVVGIVLAAAVRCFFSSTLDALGAEPDATFNELDPRLRGALVVGRPIER